MAGGASLLSAVENAWNLRWQAACDATGPMLKPVLRYGRRNPANVDDLVAGFYCPHGSAAEYF